MGVGFALAGTYRPATPGQSSEDWLAHVGAWLEGHETEPLLLARSGVDDAGCPALFVHVHPCADEVSFVVPEPGRVVVAAQTSTAGPGYHVFLCRLLHQLGHSGHIDWDTPAPDAAPGDETGYFHTGDDEAVRREMLRWLAALARILIEHDSASDAAMRMVAMPFGYGYPDEPDVITPIGPRPLEWFHAVAAGEGRGAEFFPWWDEEVGASFFLGRALARLWQDVRWRPAISDDEGELLMDIHLDLERAFHHDPDAAVPWHAWQELLGYLIAYYGYAEYQYGEDLEEVIAERAAALSAEARLVGYRRGRIVVQLTGGWSVVIPGELAEEWEPNRQVWSAWLGGRTLLFSSTTVRDDQGQPVAAADILASLELPAGDLYDMREGAVVGRAVFAPMEEDGIALWHLKAYSVVEGGFAQCDFYLRERDDLGWAIDIWKGVRH